MRFRTFLFVAALATWPSAAGAQTPAPKQSVLTPREVVDAPKEAVGAKVTWTVRYHHVFAEIQADGKVGESRVAYEWRDPFGVSEPVLIIGPSLQDTRFIGPAGSAIVLETEPRQLSATVRSVVPSSGVDGKGGLAVVVDEASIAPVHIAEKHRLGAGVDQHTFVPGQGATWPVVLKESKPVYPPEAIPSKTEGTVELELTIAADGKVSDVRITKSLDQDGPLDKPAISAAKQWLFKPGVTKDGVPVPVKVSLILDFKVKK